MIPSFATTSEHKSAAFDDAQREWHTPPFPIPEVETLDTLMQARHVWRQTVADHEPVESGWTADPVELERLKRERERRLSRQVDATANPLRELAAALVAFADQLDQHEMVPLAVNLTTGHPKTYASPIWGERAVIPAEVHVTVRGVRRQWIDHLTAEEYPEEAHGGNVS